jgi:hypothetical protein
MQPVLSHPRGYRRTSWQWYRALATEEAEGRSHAQATAAQQPPKPASESELAALREQVAELQRQLAEAEKTDTFFARFRETVTENKRLKKQIADLLTPGGVSAADALRIAELNRENKRLKADNATLRAKLANDPGTVAELERKLKALRASKGAVISKSDKRKLDKVFHPDKEPHADRERKAQLEEGFKIWGNLNFKVM